MDSGIWDHKGRHGNWSASEVKELEKLIKEGHTDSALWGNLDGSKFRSAVNGGDPFEVLEVIEEFLEDEGYPSSDIRQLRKIMDKEGLLKDISTGDVAMLRDVANKMDDSGRLNDMDALNRLEAQLDGGPKEVTKLGSADDLLIGHGNHDAAWSGDISDLIK